MNTAIEKIKELCKTDGSFACGFIGSGNMATSIIQGIIKSKIFEPSELIVSGTKLESFEKFKDLNINTTLNNRDVVDKSRIIFLCVKPAAVQSVALAIGKSDKDFSNKTLISILAGTELYNLRISFKGCFDNINYVRAMPNTPLMVCAGATALTKDETNSFDSKLNFQVVEAIFKTLGIVEVVEESKFHAITGLSGSGPAYIYMIIEALSDGGVKQGLPRDLATRFAAQTVLGAAKTLIDTGIHPGQAKDQVTSAGGTTIHAVHELEKGNIRATLMGAVEAATKRSNEMSAFSRVYNINTGK